MATETPQFVILRCGREGTVRFRDALAARMTPDQLTEAQRLARDWDAAHPREP